METIIITLRNNIYPAWVPLFGTKSREDVLALIQGMNPGVTVTMGESI